jgi:large subunit ribosomal protein L9
MLIASQLKVRFILYNGAPASLDKAGHAIDKKFINVTGGNVKRLGKYSAVVRLHRDVAVDLPFEIIAGS